MDWSRKKEHFLNILTTHLRSLTRNRNSYHVRIPILVNTIHVTQASTQTPLNKNAEGSRHKTRHRRKYQHRFNKCLAELIEKYPPIPAHEYLKEEENESIWSKLYQNREDLSNLTKTLEELDKRLESLALNISPDI